MLDPLPPCIDILYERDMAINVTDWMCKMNRTTLAPKSVLH